MIIIIDGYNLLKLIHGSDVSERQRSACINLLGRYIKKRQHKVMIVFDAGPCIYPMQEKQHGITVIYSGSYQSADDSIIKFVQEHAQKELLVISADRELLQQVVVHNAHTLEPLIFYEKVKEVCISSDMIQALRSDGSIIKFEHDEQKDSAIDDLMYEAAAMNIPYKDDQLYSGSFLKKNELSKKDKIRSKALNKL